MPSSSHYVKLLTASLPATVVDFRVRERAFYSTLVRLVSVAAPFNQANTEVIIPSPGSGNSTLGSKAAHTRCAGTVLIIDDDQGVLRSVGRYLRRQAYLVFTAPSLRDGFAELERRTPDLIMLDLYLRDGHGFTLLKHIRALSDQTPVILGGATCHRVQSNDARSAQCVFETSVQFCDGEFGIFDGEERKTSVPE